MSLPQGASFVHGEFERVEKALEALAKDHHAPRQISVAVNLHVYHEFPRAVYKGGKSLIVHSNQQLEAALKDGFSPDAPVPEQE